MKCDSCSIEKKNKKTFIYCVVYVSELCMTPEHEQMQHLRHYAYAVHAHSRKFPIFLFWLSLAYTRSMKEGSCLSSDV